MPTDTTERGLERLICTTLAGHACEPLQVDEAREPPASYGGAGWHGGTHQDYDREHCVDLAQLTAFLQATQPHLMDALGMGDDCPARRSFLARLCKEAGKRGTIEVLRHGIKHGPHRIELFYGTPSAGNAVAGERFEQNRFTVTRQLQYSRTNAGRALDMALFINGLPILTFELKNNLTKQTARDAIKQYKSDRDPREKLFQFGRCVAHFAVDENEAHFCTHLRGRRSRFLPFNRGHNKGAGNPPNPSGIKTEYLWREVLERRSLTDILENYAQIVGDRQIWPRYHQLDVVRRLLRDAWANGAGKRYLIQHSAGSGKSNSIAWLAHQMTGMKKKDGDIVFDSIAVITDRRILDRQIEDTIKQFAQVSAIVGHADNSGDLRRFIEQGKKIVISTVQKFPFIIDAIGNDQRGRKFAIIIDEAHSSQGGRAAASMARALSAAGAADADETVEDQINRLMESRRLLPNASYFAFTATPKPKTLEIFGAAEPQPDGRTRHNAFHTYSMKQAIEEGFILDVLARYATVDSYYRLAKTVEDDPKFDTKKALKKLRRYVERHDHAIGLKAGIMVDHFHEQALARGAVGGEARAMVVTDGIRQAVQYFHAISGHLRERGDHHRAIVAFSGEHEIGGKTVSEASLNGFPANMIAEKIREHPYRFLICADKFQTGYDEPLLHSMYVDKMLSDIKAVQTLSRLNRAHPGKRDVLVLDFRNDADTIKDAFDRFYKATILADETDPNRLHDLQADLDGAQVYADAEVDDFVRRYLGNAPRHSLEPVLNECVARYTELGEDAQVDFKGGARGFVRSYGFLSAVLPFTNADWEKREIFLRFLIPKLPSPPDDDLSRGILSAIDMDSYRTEKQALQKIILADEDALVDPVPPAGGGQRPEPELDLLSRILERFNSEFGNIEWKDADRVIRLMLEDIPDTVRRDIAYSNAMRNNDQKTARIEMEKALKRVVLDMMADQTDLFAQYSDNESFRKWLEWSVFALTYNRPEGGPRPAAP